MQETAAVPCPSEVEASRWSSPRQRILHRALRHDPSTEYYCYVPATAREGARVLTVVHGISGRAQDYAQVFAPFCENQGVVLVAPHFAQHHRDFQRLGRVGRGPRADEILDQCLAEVGWLTSADVSRIHLFGYSGGAQFAHRYVMAHPHRVARAVVAAAGWYTFPDPAQRFPYGIAPSRKLPGVTFDVEEFLKVPVEVLVGEEDTTSADMRSTARVNEQQGTSRLERARRWVRAMREAAESRGLPPLTTCMEIPGLGHRFNDFRKREGLTSRVFASLFSGDLPDVAAGQPGSD